MKDSFFGTGLGDVSTVVEEACEDAFDVAIDGGGGLVEGNGGDGSGGVGTDAGKRLQGFEVVGEFLGGKCDDGLGKAMEEFGATVVAESFPLFEDGGFVGLGEGLPGGEAGEPTLEVGDHGGDLSLLEHELGNGDSIGGGVLTPREVALGKVEPIEEEGSEGLP